MSYEVINWQDSPSHNTALEAAKLNHMDSGIAANASSIEGFQSSINSISQTNENLNTQVTQILSRLNGLTFVTCTRAAYNAMASHPATTVYIFVG